MLLFSKPLSQKKDAFDLLSKSTSKCQSVFSTAVPLAPKNFQDTSKLIFPDKDSAR